MEYDSEISMDALNKLLRHFNSKKLANYANGGVNDGVDPYANYDGYTRDLMDKATQDPKSLTRRERKYLEQEHGFFPGFDSMGAPPAYDPRPEYGAYNGVQNNTNPNQLAYNPSPNNITYEEHLKSLNKQTQPAYDPRPDYGVHPDVGIPPGTIHSTNTYSSAQDLARAQSEGKFSKEQWGKILQSKKEGTYGTGPSDLRTEEEIEDAWNRGEISKEEYDNIYTKLSEQSRGTTQPEGTDPYGRNLVSNFPYLSPDISPTTAAGYFGMFAANKDKKGSKLGMLASGLGAGLDLARTGLSSYSNEKVRRESQDYYTKKMLESGRYYTPQSQYWDTNYTGGQSFAKYGGIMKYFEGGMPPTGEPLPVAVQNILRSQDTTGKRKMATFTDSEIYNAAILARTNAFEALNTSQARTMGGPGMGDARVLDDFLIKNYKEEAAEYFRNRNNQFSSGAPVVNRYGDLMKYFSGGLSNTGDNATQLLDLFFQPQNQGTPNPNQTAMGNDSLSEATNSQYQVGQPVTFEYGGKKVSGTIKEIKNGKIYI